MGVIARICLYAILALGLNIVVGFAGLLDIGYVAFFGIGSYVYAFLASPHFGIHLPFLVALPIVVASTAVSGVIIGAPTLRVRGDYLAMVTLGFGEIVYLLLVNLDRPINITGGPSGIIGVDPPSFAGLVPDSNVEYYFLFLAFLAFAVVISMRLRDSRIGWAWQAIREDELAAQAMGINVFVAKLQAFAIGAAFAGIGGCLLGVVAAFGLSRELHVHRIDQHPGDGHPRRHGQPVRGDPRRRADRRVAGAVPRVRAIPAARVRLHADGADGVPAAGSADLPRPPPGGAGRAARTGGAVPAPPAARQQAPPAGERASRESARQDAAAWARDALRPIVGGRSSGRAREPIG